jgi:hypothetical protein
MWWGRLKKRRLGREKVKFSLPNCTSPSLCKISNSRSGGVGQLKVELQGKE